MKARRWRTLYHDSCDDADELLARIRNEPRHEESAAEMPADRLSCHWCFTRSRRRSHFEISREFLVRIIARRRK